MSSAIQGLPFKENASKTDNGSTGRSKQGSRSADGVGRRTIEALTMPYSQIENERMRAAMQDRSPEWISALFMIWWGVALAMPGDTMAGPSFTAFDRYGLTEEFWAWAFGSMGAARCVALYINGRWPKTPWVRMTGALFGAVSWMQVAWLLFAGSTLETGIYSTGTGVYLIIAVADLFSIFRAAFDARYYNH